ncbi:metallophosphoesterase [Proteinivorax hydrogeniformans]|uniref:Metallophosphoesterase n=1 Tax=Proteinivorax hydrogeniformans TaxID=1826727 RepID=A0AAU8HNP0_9FIRM
MKIVYITDTHFRGGGPRSRTDDFVNTCYNKLDEVVNYCNLHEVNLLLHGGDFFDRPNISLSVLGEIVGILQKCKCPIMGIAGNHDIYGHNPKTLPRTMLGLMSKLGIIDLLSHDGKIVNTKDVGVQLTGANYIYDYESKEQYIVKKQFDCDFSIHLVHGMLLPKKSVPVDKMTLVESISNTEADITLAGHYHHGFGCVDYNGKKFINPGSLLRVDNSLSELSRSPQMLEIQLTKGKVPEIKFIPIKAAQRGDIVLDRSQLEEKQIQTDKLDDFLTNITDITSNQHVSAEQIISLIANNEDISPKVKEKALSIVSTVQQSFNDNEDF